MSFIFLINTSSIIGLRDSVDNISEVKLRDNLTKMKLHTVTSTKIHSQLISTKSSAPVQQLWKMKLEIACTIHPGRSTLLYLHRTKIDGVRAHIIDKFNKIQETDILKENFASRNSTALLLMYTSLFDSVLTNMQNILQMFLQMIDQQLPCLLFYIL